MNLVTRKTNSGTSYSQVRLPAILLAGLGTETSRESVYRIPYIESVPLVMS
jgi:hypothetical protein